LITIFANIINWYDMRMFEVGHRLGFEVEPLDLDFRGVFAETDHLEGDGPVEADLAGPIDDAHAASTQDLEQFIITEDAPLGADGVSQRFRVAAGLCFRVARIGPRAGQGTRPSRP